MHTIYGKQFARFYNDNWAIWSAGVWPFLLETVRKRNPHAATWLDLCCGTGDLLEKVCRHGYAASGIDLSPHQLAHARRNAPRAALARGDIRTLKMNRAFDVVTCLFDSLNYLTVRKDLLAAFRTARDHLAEKGLFIFDMNTFEGMHDLWCRTTAVHDRNGTVIVETSFDGKRARGRGLITGFMKEGKLYRRFREEHVERGYRASEIEACLERAGFLFRKYDGESLSRPRKRSARLVYVCKRK